MKVIRVRVRLGQGSLLSLWQAVQEEDANRGVVVGFVNCWHLLNPQDVLALQQLPQKNGTCLET